MTTSHFHDALHHLLACVTQQTFNRETKWNTKAFCIHIVNARAALHTEYWHRGDGTAAVFCITLGPCLTQCFLLFTMFYLWMSFPVVLMALQNLKHLWHHLHKPRFHRFQTSFVLDQFFIGVTCAAQLVEMFSVRVKKKIVFFCCLHAMQSMLHSQTETDFQASASHF